MDTAVLEKLNALDPVRRQAVRELLAEKKAREDSITAIRNYKPLPVVDRFHRSKAKFRLLVGGNRSSKT